MSNVNDAILALFTLAGTSSEGSELINDTTSHVDNYSSIVFLEDTVFTSLTGNHIGWSGITYPAGLVLNGWFSEIHLASGSVIAYKR